MNRFSPTNKAKRDHRSDSRDARWLIQPKAAAENNTNSYMNGAERHSAVVIRQKSTRQKQKYI